MTDVRFAIVGCGRVSSKHIDAVADTAGARLVAVCDIDVERARAASRRAGVPWFEDIDAMLSSVPEVDVVGVLTPSGYHAQHAIRVARHKKHVIVEKPMALRLEDADDMIRATERAGVRLFVVKQNRFNPPVRRLRAAIDADRFGKMVMGTARVRWCRLQDYYDHDGWRGTRDLDGGVLANQASHYIDLLIWLLGPVDSVMAMSAARLAKIETDDTAGVLLRFASGAIGIVEATTATRPVDLEGSLTILGERGAVELGGFAVNEIVTWNFAPAIDSDRGVLRESHAASPSVYGLGHRDFIANVVRAVRGESAELVDGHEGRRSIEVLAAINESMSTSREVKVHARWRPLAEVSS
ncbi:MAG TPA: Gfo/Idh/MocA family oxidoreductase [Polyangiales bacterium]|jgi:predicted dehydrogenase|nr:Gfo/Idh/MocA family oxidoreductase [Polyangiales bacterium]